MVDKEHIRIVKLIKWWTQHLRIGGLYVQMRAHENIGTAWIIDVELKNSGTI